MSKNKLMEEICEICDCIAEMSLQNRQFFDGLKKSYPTSKVLDEFTLLQPGIFEHQTFSTLRKFDQQELSEFKNDAMAFFDQLIDQECQLEKLEVKIKRRRNSPGQVMRKSVENNKENWDFLLQNTRAKGECLDDRMDSLIQNVKKISTCMAKEMEKTHKSRENMLRCGKSEVSSADDSYRQRFMEEIHKNEEMIIINQQLTSEIDILKESITYMEYQLSKKRDPVIVDGMVTIDSKTYQQMLNRIQELENQKEPTPKKPDNDDHLLRLKKLEELEDYISMVEQSYIKQ